MTATTYKTLLADDITPVRSKLHEAIPITGTIISGTYSQPAGSGNPLNIKNYAHGMFQSVYDYPYLSSSANHIFDLTVGIGKDSVHSHSATSQIDQKLQIYNEMAQVLAGNDVTGGINLFDNAGDFTGTNDAQKMKEVIFFNFARLLTKDEIQKGSFNLQLGVSPSSSLPAGPFGAAVGKPGQKIVNITDTSASANVYRVNSPAGEYGVLFITGAAGTDFTITGALGEPGTGNGKVGGGLPCGLLFYQAGIAVITASVFQTGSNVQGSRPGAISDGLLSPHLVIGNAAKITTAAARPVVYMVSASLTTPGDINNVLVTSSISGAANAIENRIYNVSFNNTTELNSTVYFCRANSNEFNYSSNPTYLTGSKIRVKETRSEESAAYVTTVGLYGADNSLLAVAKTSEPIKKQPSNEFTLRVRLDY